jgi:Dual specificity phosphatase, catalytic domain.
MSPEDHEGEDAEVDAPFGRALSRASSRQIRTDGGWQEDVEANEIAGTGLYVSGISYVYEEDVSGFDVVITVCEDSVRDYIPDDTSYRYFCMADGEHGSDRGEHSYELFEMAVNRVRQARVGAQSDSTPPCILVHCHMGQSRSVSVVTAALAADHEMSVETALEQVRDERPQADPNDDMLELIEQYVDVHGD